MKASLGLRKGAWTEEEDALLRKCVQRHGEGRWHLVPSRAGSTGGTPSAVFPLTHLLECRKSCRLRWLNYLKPNIKRGEFEYDEVDMIIRLHNLLGNRWSLIAGRIPGRTANDVKNYWNTHLAKKLTSTDEKPKPKPPKIIKISALKPRARTFSKSSAWLRGKATLITSAALQQDNNITDNRSSLSLETEVAWWEGLLSKADDFDRAPASAIPSEEALLTKTVDEEAIRGNSHVWDDISLDIDIWQLLGTTPQPSV